MSFVTSFGNCAINKPCHHKYKFSCWLVYCSRGIVDHNTPPSDYIYFIKISCNDSASYRSDAIQACTQEDTHSRTLEYALISTPRHAQLADGVVAIKYMCYSA